METVDSVIGEVSLELLRKLGIENSKARSFTEIIEEIVWMRDISYIEAVILYCEKSGMEVEYAAEKIGDTIIKDRIRVEAESLSYLPKSSRLPI